MKPLKVLMVAGAYYPEPRSGGGLQCREIVRALRDRVQFTVFSVSMTSSLQVQDTVDGVPVYRIAVDVNRLSSKLAAAGRLAWRFLRLRRRFDLVHLHSVSEKNILLTVLALLCRKRLVLTLHTAGRDEPLAVRTNGRLASWCYARADLVVGVSPRFQEGYQAAGLPREKFQLIPNGVDVERFRPPGDQAERDMLRRELGLPLESPVILFVGFFSRDKRPHLLFDAWKRLQADGLPAAWLVFIGATRPGYHEIDPLLAPQIRSEAHQLGIERQVMFVESAHQVEKYYRAADVFVLPSLREGLPVALLEAMASGLPCVASRLPGATDAVIEHGVNGLLVPPGDVVALEQALAALLLDEETRRAYGERARQTILERYVISQTAARHHEIYLQVNGRASSHHWWKRNEVTG